ncbi:hypothetical protein DPMN_013379 [Dreissena polymorpha]|uniref:Secreted protein n=1 Tax=Dreissena polymorpha TaxID=45954 RepID=A0A9D4N5C5_DREPO|nr:hypothetical protein DPMN_013379 [Dreissena polymorpha]
MVPVLIVLITTSIQQAVEQIVPFRTTYQQTVNATKANFKRLCPTEANFTFLAVTKGLLQIYGN